MLIYIVTSYSGKQLQVTPLATQEAFLMVPKRVAWITDSLHIRFFNVIIAFVIHL